MDESLEQTRFDRRKLLVGAGTVVAGAALAPAVAQAGTDESPWTGGVVSAPPSGDAVAVTQSPLAGGGPVRVDLPGATVRADLRPGQTVMIQGPIAPTRDEIDAERIVNAVFGSSSELASRR